MLGSHLYRRGLKRVLDLTLVLLTCPLWLPVLMVAGVGTRVVLGRPVLFRQQRPGRGGKPFEIYKLRTMSNRYDDTGRVLPDEARLTRFGRLLRATSLDELPELLNVLRGDMSLVGPRPLLMQYIQRYSIEQARRHEVLPGITGWAQVNGRNTASWEQKFHNDVWYVDHCSLWLDLRILTMTLRQVVACRDISAENHATMPEFMGSDNHAGS